MNEILSISWGVILYILAFIAGYIAMWFEHPLIVWFTTLFIVGIILLLWHSFRKLRSLMKNHLIFSYFIDGELLLISSYFRKIMAHKF